MSIEFIMSYALLLTVSRSVYDLLPDTNSPYSNSFQVSDWQSLQTSSVWDGKIKSTLKAINAIQKREFPFLLKSHLLIALDIQALCFKCLLQHPESFMHVSTCLVNNLSLAVHQICPPGPCLEVAQGDDVCWLVRVERQHLWLVLKHRTSPGNISKKTTIQNRKYSFFSW